MILAVRLLLIPNVAANLRDMQRTDHIAGLLETRGFSTRTVRAGGAPYVYAELADPLVFCVRGDVTVDVTTLGATRPPHSGHYGNWAPNPIMRLAHLLASMRDPAGRRLARGATSARISPQPQLMAAWPEG